MNDQEILNFLRRHLESIYTRDWITYQATTAEDLALYEHFVTPHRQDGLAFHRFMIENSWATGGRSHHLSLLEPRVQWLADGQVAVISYTLMLSLASDSGIEHRSVNETRVIENREGEWQVVHVHKSPAGA
ncbi:ketosteroid isomerase-like protein [Deinobacterium chartae]|uniref:Ketosteroid isomerase-like protein n=1 Tax=Deinobacterium chartae TaxID=521158 RepID=A0A841HY03_9DEIO|nr:nuclear transport factor 2 family protein [Deinobacterium chartae]MBB6096808.1 ketosteroid isomerase-like protein [Deinobacterium chartae]